MRTRIVPVLLLLSAALTACGSDDGGDPAAAPEAGSSASPGTGRECAPAVENPDDVESEPGLTVPPGGAVEELVSTDLKEGTGAAAALGQDITVHYVGVSCTTGEKFDSSWDRGEPVTFPLVEGGLIAGWTEAIPGMKEGGRRLLVIPSDLAYGPAGSPPAIGADESLAFVVDLVKAG